MKILETRRGARITYGGHVLSELPAEPGPTNSVFDVMSAVAALYGHEHPVAMLGFAGGGAVAPLRALACDLPVEAVDLDLTAVPIFRRLARDWAGEVKIHRAEASAWLRAHPGRFSCVIEDLSRQVHGDVLKPAVSFDVLPALIAQKLAPGGVAVVNLLPDDERTAAEALHAICHPFSQGLCVMVDGFSNHLLVLGSALPSAERLSRELRLALWTIGSELGDACRVRTIPAAALGESKPAGRTAATRRAFAPGVAHRRRTRARLFVR